VALSPMKQLGKRRPRAATYYDAPGNQETMTKTTTDSTLLRMADEPPPCLQCRHGPHSSTMSHLVMTWPQDHDDSHARTSTRRWHSLQAKLARTSLRLTTLWSGEPLLCISPVPKLYIRTARATHSESSTIPFVHHSSRASEASLWATPRLA
jgi:hypothetical protein